MRIRKHLSLLFALVLGAGLLAAVPAAYAEDDSADLATVTTYDLWVAGIQVTSDNAADVLGDNGSAVFDEDTATLTLTNATIPLADVDNVDSNIAAGIYNNEAFENGLTIDLVGSNSVVMPQGTLSAGWLYGIGSADGSVFLEGEGSLSLTLAGGRDQFVFGIDIRKNDAVDYLDLDIYDVAIEMDLSTVSGESGYTSNLVGISADEDVGIWIYDADIEIDLTGWGKAWGIDALDCLDVYRSSIDISFGSESFFARGCTGVCICNYSSIDESSTLTITGGAVPDGKLSQGIEFYGYGHLYLQSGAVVKVDVQGTTGVNVGLDFENNYGNEEVIDLTANCLFQVVSSASAIKDATNPFTDATVGLGILVDDEVSGSDAALWDGETSLSAYSYIRIPGDTASFVVDFGTGHEDFVQEFYGEGGSYTTSGKYPVNGSKVTFPMSKTASVSDAAQCIDDAVRGIYGYEDDGQGFFGYYGTKTMEHYSSWDDFYAETDEWDSTPATPGMTFYAFWCDPVEPLSMTLKTPAAGTQVTATYDEEYGYLTSQKPWPVFTCKGTGASLFSFGAEQPAYWVTTVPESYMMESPAYFVGTFEAGKTYYAWTMVVADFGYYFPYDQTGESYRDNITVNGEKPFQARPMMSGYNNVSVFAEVTIPEPGSAKAFQRLAGSDRYATGAAIAGTYGARGGTVILATGDNFPDALCASALAGKVGGPILMTSSKSLSAATRDTLAAIKPERIIVVGGTGAVPDSVLASACTAAGIPFDDEHTARYFGANRFATGVDIYQKGDLASDTCIIATGGNFADALSISPYAYATATPIFLVDAKTCKLDAATAEAISGQFSKVIIVGGTGVVSDDVMTQIGALQKVRLAGASRYNTSLAIAKWEMGLDTTADFGPSEPLGVSNISLATGDNFPDALTGGALCGKNGSVLLLVSEKAADYNGALSLVGDFFYSVTQGYIFGGTGAVSDGLKAKFDAALN